MMDETLRRTLLNARQSLKDMVKVGVPGLGFTDKNWDDITSFAKRQIIAISAELCEDPFHRHHMDEGSEIYPAPKDEGRSIEDIKTMCPSMVDGE